MLNWTTSNDCETYQGWKRKVDQDLQRPDKNKSLPRLLVQNQKLPESQASVLRTTMTACFCGSTFKEQFNS